MTLYAKIIFFLVIFITYSLTYTITRTSSTRAIQKLILIVFSSLLFLAILFPNTIMLGTASILGVGRGPDAILYLFIIISISINLILLKKISDTEYKIAKLVQSIALEQNKKDIF